MGDGRRIVFEKILLYRLGNNEPRPLFVRSARGLMRAPFFAQRVELSNPEALQILTRQYRCKLPVVGSKAGSEERWLDIQMRFVSFAVAKGRSFF